MSETVETKVNLGVPSEVRHAHSFSLFNSLNFQISLGMPVILYAKSLGATSTLIGIVAALAPLLTILQLPTAYFIPRIGYKSFVLLGWISRIVTLFCLAALPMAGALSVASRISLLLMGLFVYNVLRGISTGAWLPWLTALVPEVYRAKFLRTDQMNAQLGGVAAMALSTLVLWRHARDWQYSLLFFFSACAGTLSLLHIRAIPDTGVGEQVKSSGLPVPWLTMFRYPPFFRLLVFNVVYNWVIGGLGAFAIGFLQSRAGYPDGKILANGLLSFVGASLSVLIMGQLLNRIGSKPLLRLSLICYLWAVVCFVLVSSGLLDANTVTVAMIYFVLGLAGGLFGVANTSIAMDTMPVMGRNHFFALFTVFTSASLGLSPVVWGIFLDLFGTARIPLGNFELNRYSLYFVLLTALVVITVVLTQSLVEKKGQPISLALRDAVIYSRLRLFNRFLNR